MKQSTIKLDFGILRREREGRPRMRMSKDLFLRLITGYFGNLVMIAIAVLWLLPIGWLLGTSVKPVTDSYGLPPSFFPLRWNLENYRKALLLIPFGRYALNSFIVSMLSSCGMIVVSIMAAYSFARINFAFRGILFPVMLAGLMIPSQAFIIPRFIIIQSLSLFDTYWALILPAIYYPLAVFLLRQFIMTIPMSLDESAYMDGASRMQILRHIILPISNGPIMVSFILSFLTTWNDFFNAMIFINKMEIMTLPLGITTLRTAFGTFIPLISSGIFLSILVPILIFMFGQKYIMNSLSITSGIKS